MDVPTCSLLQCCDIAYKKVKALRQWNEVIPEHASVLFYPAGAGVDVSVEEHGSCWVSGDKCFHDCMQVGEGRRLQDVSPVLKDPLPADEMAAELFHGNHSSFIE